jgi:hypothetical protein
VCEQSCDSGFSEIMMIISECVDLQNVVAFPAQLQITIAVLRQSSGVPITCKTFWF